MKLPHLFIVFLFTTPLFGQNYTVNLDGLEKDNQYEFIAFPDLSSNEIYAVSFKKEEIFAGEYMLWRMNTKTNKTTKKVILKQRLSGMTKVKNMFYYSKHIFCLKQTDNFQYLILQPLSLKEEATFKPRFINLSKLKEQYIGSKLINDCLYIFTGSRKKKSIKIYKIDLNKDGIDEMKIPLTYKELRTLKISSLYDERDFTKIMDHKDFSHPNQLLVKNKIYFEEGKIIFLFQPSTNKPHNIFYKIDFEAKTFDKKTLSFATTNPIFNAIYHNDYIYRFCRNSSSVIVEGIGLIPKNKTVRYVTNRETAIPFQQFPTQKISFSSAINTPLVSKYISNTLKVPYPKRNHKTIGLLEYEADNIVIYTGYTPIDVQQTSYHKDFGATFKSFDPSDLDYYLMETNLSPKQNDTRRTFRVPTFAKVIAGCKNIGLETKNFDPNQYKYKLKNEVAGVQIHRLKDGFYGSFFDTVTNNFCLKKLVDAD